MIFRKRLNIVEVMFDIVGKVFDTVEQGLGIVEKEFGIVEELDIAEKEFDVVEKELDIVWKETGNLAGLTDIEIGDSGIGISFQRKVGIVAPDRYVGKLDYELTRNVYLVLVAKKAGRGYHSESEQVPTLYSEKGV